MENVSLKGFNRAARFARLVATTQEVCMKRMKPCFNRAARFARLVASIAGIGRLDPRGVVSIGPRVSRGWWRVGWTDMYDAAIAFQ